MRFYLTVISIIAISLNLNACDVCGGSVSNFGNGSLTSYKYDFISMSWSNQSFRQNGNQSDGSLDFINNLSLSSQYHINDRLRVFGLLSYGYKYRYQDDNKIEISGIGDTQLGFSYKVFNQLALSSKVDLSFDLGGSILLPTGQYDSNIHDKDVPLNFNIGRKNISYIINPLIHLNFQTGGLVANAQWLVSSKTPNGYLFGNQNVFSLLLYKSAINIQGFEFTPNMGWQYEKSQNDTYANLNSVPDTGSNTHFLQFGVQIKKATYSLGVTYFKSIVQNYSNGASTSNGRLSTQLFYFF